MAEERKTVRPFEGFQEKFVRSNVDVCIGGGVLNPQPIDSYVITPFGEKILADIQVGDEICDTNGGVQIVNYTIDKGKMQCVRFTLDDGRTVESALEHHWKVFEKHGKELDVTAKEIVDYIDSRKEYSNKHKNWYRIPNTAPIYHKDIYKDDRKIDAYLLGYLIGNGCCREKDLVCFCSSDDSVAHYFESIGYMLKVRCFSDNYRVYSIQSRQLKNEIRKLNLMDVHADKKFIPDSYKYAPIEIRLGVLQGLMDADGCAIKSKQKKYRCTYVSVSKKLIDDIKYIIYSLGGKCYISTTPQCCRFINNRDKITYCKESYHLTIHLPNNKDLFRLRRKKDLAQTNEQRKVKPYLSIKSYELIGEKECKCINVSGIEHLYLTDNCIITRNCGKTFAATLLCAEPSLDPKFRAVFLRNNLGDLKSGGGVLDEIKEVFGAQGVSVTESGEPRADFPSGARIDVTHIADQSRAKVRQRFKGRQYDLIYFDEMTGFSWVCFTEVCTRNRGTGKWTGKIRGTTNPERDHWLRVFLDWYIGDDGFIREDRQGVVRYFYMAGATVYDVVWGNTKEDVYRKCKIQIDRQLDKINGVKGKATYKDMIRSFTFYLGRMSENKASLDRNSGYVGAVAMSGGANAQQLLEGNWNVSTKQNLLAPIPMEAALSVMSNDPQINGDKWITCDLADTGTDNFLAIAWNGFHIIDFIAVGKTTPRENATILRAFAEKHDVADCHIIYDAIRGTYINDYIPDAVPFISYHAPVGLYSRLAYNLKTECYFRVVEAVKQGYLSVDEKVGMRIYEHQKLTQSITFFNEFVEECSVVMFKDTPSGKKTLQSKKEMNKNLGKDRSMDVLDPIAMRYLPCLEFEYGEELMKSVEEYREETYETENKENSVFDDSTWY